MRRSLSSKLARTLPGVAHCRDPPPITTARVDVRQLSEVQERPRRPGNSDRGQGIQVHRRVPPAGPPAHLHRFGCGGHDPLSLLRDAVPFRPAIDTVRRRPAGQFLWRPKRGLRGAAARLHEIRPVIPALIHGETGCGSGPMRKMMRLWSNEENNEPSSRSTRPTHLQLWLRTTKPIGGGAGSKGIGPCPEKTRSSRSIQSSPTNISNHYRKI